MKIKAAKFKKEELLTKAVALLLIMALTMADFVLLGVNAVSYAADAITSETATNNKNVTFDSYFKDENGTAMATKEEGINNNDIKLFMKVSVKNEGYFNGTITLEDSNFKFKNEVLSNGINKIENNTITLNQVNAGETSEVEVGIEPLKQDTVSSEFFSKESNVKISGTYKDSSERQKNVEATRQVQLILNSPYAENDGLDLACNVLTNKVYKINGEDKRLVQVLVQGGLKDNQYPVKETNIEINVPDGVENVEAFARSTAATNANKEFTSNNWTYSKDENKVKINISNKEENGAISWAKNAKDEIIVTYTLAADANIKGTEITAKEIATLYDKNSTAKEASASIKVSDDVDGIITSGVQTSETEFYKGKLYSGEDKTYQVSSKIYINNKDVEKAIDVSLAEAKYETENAELDANSQYISTTVNKSEVTNVLGENGTLTIKTGSGDIVKQISSQTEADENGNVTINYPENVKSLKIESTNVKNTGTINLNNIKAIKKEAYDKNTIMTIKSLKEVTPNDEARINLQNTTTEATFEINRDTLSTVVSNDLHMKVVLDSANEKYDLYKNPVVTITVPEEIEKFEVKNVQLLYEDELKIAKTTLNGNVLTIAFEGEQTNYKENSLEGATILIDATAAINRKTPTLDTEFKMTYTNDNAISIANGGVATIPAKIQAPTDVTTVTTIPELGVETLDQNNSQNVKLELNADKKEITPGLEVINNKQEEISDVKIIGTLPTDSSKNNADISLQSGVQLKTPQNATIYYTENENATTDLDDENNGWTSNAADLNKEEKYLIHIDSLKPQESVEAEYKAEIAENLDYNKGATTGYQVVYNTNENVQNNVAATAVNLTTGQGPVAELNLETKVGNDTLKDGDTVKTGEVIKYTLNVKNTGSEPITDGTVTATVPEGTTLVKPTANYEYTGTLYYDEQNAENYESKIKNLPAGETTQVEYEVRVNNNTENGKELKNNAKITYKEKQTETQGVTLKAESGDLRVTVKRVTDTGDELYSGTSVRYYAIVENISNKEQKNVKVGNYFSNNYEIESAELLTGVDGYKVSDDDLRQVTVGNEIEGASSAKTDDENEGATPAGDAINKNVETKEIEYKENKDMNIDNLKAGEAKVICIDAKIKNLTEPTDLGYYAIAKADGKTYRSNLWKEHAENYKISAKLTANVQDQYVKPGDTIEYKIIVKNETAIPAQAVEVSDSIPDSCNIESISVDGQNLDLPEYGNEVNATLSLGANEEKTVVVGTTVEDSLDRTEAEQITNKANAAVESGENVDTNTVTNIIEATKLLDDADGTSGTNGGANNQVQDNNYANGTKTISGIAWIDSNKNGKKDENEQATNGVTAKLLNIETNQYVKTSDGKDLEATTNNDGLYMLNNIGNGKYVVVFGYNANEYGLTQYKAEGASEAENSNATMSDLTIGGNTSKLATTDTIDVNNDNIGNQNIGLVKLQNFDLQLDKYVNKIVVKDSKGTKTTEFGDAKTAKVELNYRTINTANVVVEYKIKVSNVGEIDGYAKKIADYIPSGLKFSSESNPDWYQQNGVLYTTSLANQKIAAGETKELTLVLTKAMNENNLGLVSNTAEIAEDYNDFGLSDSNSTPGNRQNGENDMSSAETILSLKTGASIIAVVIAIVALVILATVIAPIVKQKNKLKNKRPIDKV